MPAKKKTEPKSLFLKFTKLDGNPIWINSSFVVTVEPRRGGGTTVVPIGDGLDYDVRETPETVLALLAGAEPPAVVPVPAPPGLAPKPAYAKPEPEAASETKPEAKPAVKQEPKSAEAVSAPPEGVPTAAALLNEDLERLRRMAPGTVRKLHNTLVKQFKVTDPDAVVRTLADTGAITVTGTHVVWSVK